MEDILLNRRFESHHSTGINLNRTQQQPDVESLSVLTIGFSCRLK